MACVESPAANSSRAREYCALAIAFRSGVTGADFAAVGVETVGAVADCVVAEGVVAAGVVADVGKIVREPVPSDCGDVAAAVFTPFADDAFGAVVVVEQTSQRDAPPRGPELVRGAGAFDEPDFENARSGDGVSAAPVPAAPFLTGFGLAGPGVRQQLFATVGFTWLGVAQATGVVATGAASTPVAGADAGADTGAVGLAASFVTPPATGSLATLPSAAFGVSIDDTSRESLVGLVVVGAAVSARSPAVVAESDRESGGTGTAATSGGSGASIGVFN